MKNMQSTLSQFVSSRFFFVSFLFLFPFCPRKHADLGCQSLPRKKTQIKKNEIHAKHSGAIGFFFVFFLNIVFFLWPVFVSSCYCEYFQFSNDECMPLDILIAYGPCCQGRGRDCTALFESSEPVIATKLGQTVLFLTGGMGVLSWM